MICILDFIWILVKLGQGAVGATAVSPYNSQPSWIQKLGRNLNLGFCTGFYGLLVVGFIFYSFVVGGDRLWVLLQIQQGIAFSIPAFVMIWFIANGFITYIPHPPVSQSVIMANATLRYRIFEYL